MARTSTSMPAACLLAISLFMIAAPWPARGQAVAVAEVSGTISDPTGLILPGAEVIVTETGKQLTRSTLTDPSGHYVLTNLPVGPYKLEASLPGFRSFVQTNSRSRPPGSRIICNPALFSRRTTIFRST